MIRKTIILARALPERFEDDRARVFSPGGAAENSPGLKFGVGERLKNPLSPGGATHCISVSGALMTKEGFAIPGLNIWAIIRCPYGTRQWHGNDTALRIPYRRHPSPV